MYIDIFRNFFFSKTKSDLTHKHAQKSGKREAKTKKTTQIFRIYMLFFGE